MQETGVSSSQWYVLFLVDLSIGLVLFSLPSRVRVCRGRAAATQRHRFVFQQRKQCPTLHDYVSAGTSLCSVQWVSGRLTGTDAIELTARSGDGRNRRQQPNGNVLFLVYAIFRLSSLKSRILHFVVSQHSASSSYMYPCVSMKWGKSDPCTSIGLSAETTGGDVTPTSSPANVKLARDGGLSSALSSVTNAAAVTASTDSTVVPRTAA